MLDDLDHADDVVAIVRLLGKRIQIQDAKPVFLSQQLRVGTDVMSGEFERPSLQRAPLAQIFEETARATAEIEPPQRRGRCGTRRVGSRGQGGGGRKNLRSCSLLLAPCSRCAAPPFS